VSGHRSGPIRRVVARVGAGVDYTAMRAAGAVASAHTRRKRRRIPDDAATRMHLLADIAHAYPPDAAGFHPPSRDLTPRVRRVRRLRDGGAVLDLRWPSDRPTWLPNLAAALRDPRSDHAATRLWVHEKPRRTAVLVHGYMAGQWTAERILWPIDRMYRNGWDVGVFVLPYHGVRTVPRRMVAPRFPSRDPRRTNESLRHAVADLRDLMGWLRARGAPTVGLMGMSLGGYTASLAATIEREVDFLVPVIPLASIADFALARGHLGDGPDAGAQRAALDLAHRAVSPLHRAPLIEPGRTFVVAAAGDRITPLDHAERLADHFDAPLHVWSGSHLLQFGRGRAYRRVERFLDPLSQ